MTEDQTSLDIQIAKILEGYHPLVCISVFEKILAFLIHDSHKPEYEDEILKIFTSNVKTIIEAYKKMEKKKDGQGK